MTQKNKLTSIFDYSQFPKGYYQDILENGSAIRAAWHRQKFTRVIDCLPRINGQSILDIGCFAGSFLALLDEERFTRQVGVDVLPDQIAYALARFGSNRRSFLSVGSIADLDFPASSFDCITIIEVIEHLTKDEIRVVFEKSAKLLRKGGLLVVTTPNYTSAWPLIEILINKFSEVNYEEQHITKFTYFNARTKLGKLYPGFEADFLVRFITTTHFVAPFLAGFSRNLSDRMSMAVDHKTWKFPFGNLILMCFEKT